MTFGYNATAAFENTKAGIRDHARTLLLALGEARNGSSVSSAPLWIPFLSFPFEWIFYLSRTNESIV